MRTTKQLIKNSLPPPAPKPRGEYWRVVFSVTPYLCEPISYTAAISEPIELFIERNKDSNQTMYISMAQPCSSQEYNLYKKFNPTRYQYARLKKEDYLKS